MNLGIISQTPLVKFDENVESDELTSKELENYKHSYTVGGVSIMVNNLIERLQKERFANKVFWFSLNPPAPKRIIMRENFELRHIKMPNRMLKSYTNFKEILWNNIHGLKHGRFSREDYLGFLNYNWLATKEILEIEERIDILMIHDYQQLMVGSMLGPVKPSVLEWHIPFIPENFTFQIKKFLVNGLEGFDTVIVSTKRDLEGLIRAGYRGVAYQIYPNIDPEKWKRVPEEKAVEFAESYGIKDGDFMILNVARMDPIKSQDTLIRSVAILKKSIPNIKLMLVGNGSFTSSTGGLGSSKGEMHRQFLQNLARDLRVEDRVIFTGYLHNEDLFRAYQRANLFVLPSRMEGFGLTVVEAWLYGKVTIVSRGAGVSELITDGLNGYKFNPGDHRELARLILKVYKERKDSKEMGLYARKMARQCFISNVYRQIERVLKETAENFKH
ncbi:MAG: glycosyltransferase family 4 protein [Thermoplasmata archaeon]